MTAVGTLEPVDDAMQRTAIAPIAVSRVSAKFAYCEPLSGQCLGVASERRVRCSDRLAILRAIAKKRVNASYAQILTVFPGMVLQQIRNTIAIRVIRPRGVEQTELEWIHLGFVHDEAMTERRLRQGNLIGPAGYVAMEDGCVGGMVQRALRYNDAGAGVVMMGAHETQSQTFKASEATIRGFWQHHCSVMGE